MSPSAFINIYPGIQMGIEKGIYPNFNIELEGAYLFPVSSNSDLSRHGYRIKLGLKYFVSNESSLNFILFYRRVFHDRVDDFSRFNDAFFQTFEYQKSKLLIGPTIGTTNHISLSEKIMMEVGASAGIGRYKVTNQGVPVDARIANDFGLFSWYENEGNYNFIILSMQVKFKFEL